MTRSESHRNQGRSTGANRGANRRLPKRRPRLETLEDRQLLATLTWAGDVNGAWSTNVAGDTNWQGNVLPADGDTLVFPNVAGTRSMTNDTPALRRYTLNFTDGGYTLGGNQINFDSSNTISDSSSSGAANTITADIGIVGLTTITGEPQFFRPLAIDGGVNGSPVATGIAIPSGFVRFSNSSYFGTMTIAGGNAEMDGSANMFVTLTSGTLSGNGSIRGMDAQGGFVSPGTTDGITLDTLSSSQSIRLGSASFLAISASGTGAGEYDRLDVTGNVQLDEPILLFGASYVPSVGDSFTIIANDGVDPVQGMFAGLPNGSSFTTQGYWFGIRYDQGDGNDVVVTTLGVPKTLPDVYGLPENSTFTVSLASQGVLANDTNPNDRPLSAKISSGPSHGSLMLNGDGTFTYVPANDFFGVDSFLYIATDGQIDGQPTLVTLNVNQVSEPPIANNDAYSVKQNSALIVNLPGVLTNDVAPQGDPLSAAIVVAPSHAVTFTFNSDGSFIYVAAAGYTGTDTFTYRASDGVQTSNQATVVITIDPIFLEPTVVDDAFTATADQTLSVVGPGVLANDVNPNPVGALTAFIVSTTTHGQVTLAPDGSFNYTPAAGFSGTDSFTYRGIVGNAASASTATVTITVRAVNHAPIARDDVANVTKNLSVDIPVLANDSDLDPATTLTAVIVNQPQHGTVAAGPGGTLTYTPATGYTGNDFFTYRASDGSLSSEIATVNVTVNQTNLPPTANNDGFSLLQNGVLNVAAPGVLGNDVDPQNYPLTAYLVGAPSNGTVVLNGNGSFVYTPRANWSGTDTFTYLISNGSLLSAAPATVTLSVNHVAVVPTVGPDSYALTENIALAVSAPGVLLNDFNPNPSAATLTVLNQPLHGALTLNNNGSFTYTPATNYFGLDSFTYFMTSEGLNSVPTSVSLTIAGVPTTPTAVADAYTTTENTELVVPVSGVLANDLNPDLDTLRAVLVVGPTHGRLDLRADGSFAYMPDKNYFGSDSFTYRNANASLFSAPVAVSITIPELPVNPIAVADSFSVFEGGTLVITPPGLLQNDDSPNSGSPTITVFNPPSHGLLTTNNDGSFTYAPVANYFGTDTFTYYLTSHSLTSERATVTINVLGVPTTPTAVADAYTVDENLAFHAAIPGVLANDLNPDKDALRAVLVTGPTHGKLVLADDGSFVYTPDKNYFGSDSFTYRNANASLFSPPATVSITIPESPVNPIAVADSFSVFEGATLTITPPGLLQNDDSPNSGAPTITVFNQPSHGTLTTNNDGSITYTPATDYFGTDTFTYYLTSHSLTSERATVTINVLGVPTTPTAVADVYATNENTPFTAATPGVMANDLNPDKDALRAVLVAGPANGSVSLNADGSFTYTPSHNFWGTDTFTYRVANTTLFSAPATVTIAVAHVNQPPVAVADAYAIERDQNLVVPSPGVLTNDSDPDVGDTLTAVLVNSTLYGSLALHPNGSFEYSPLPGFSGVDTFTYKAFDGTLYSPAVTVTINVKDFPATTVALDPMTDTGVSQTDRITKWTSPRFVGTTEAGLRVELYERPLGSTGVPIMVGVSVADAAGNYGVISSPMPDGTYEYFVASIRPDGRSTGMISAGRLTIDTVAPRMIDVQLTPKLGQLYLTYTDVGAGLDGASAGRASNYSMAKYGKGSSPAYSPTQFHVLTNWLNPETFSVVLQFPKRKGLTSGWYMFSALAGGTSGIQDVAGNGLAGTFTGSLPSGGAGQPGDFRAYFRVGTASISLPKTANGFVPILPPIVKDNPFTNPPRTPLATAANRKTAAAAPTVKVTPAAKLPSGPQAKKHVKTK